jgi:hypothetical protein
MPTPEELTTERGQDYGHPLKHFNATRRMFAVWEARRNDALVEGVELSDREQAMRHAVYMICDKLSRSAQNPMKWDTWDDIAGYARTAKMALGLIE